MKKTIFKFNCFYIISEPFKINGKMIYRHVIKEFENKNENP